MIYSANAPMDFESANNIRELGGYINGDGIPLKKHVLLRGGDLSLLTEKEVGRLEAYGIKTSIDLRISKEKKASDPFNESNHLVYYAIPIAGAVDIACAPKDLLYTLMWIYWKITKKRSEEKSELLPESLKALFSTVPRAKTEQV